MSVNKRWLCKYFLFVFSSALRNFFDKRYFLSNLKRRQRHMYFLPFPHSNSILCVPPSECSCIGLTAVCYILALAFRPLILIQYSHCLSLFQTTNPKIDEIALITWIKLLIEIYLFSQNNILWFPIHQVEKDRWKRDYDSWYRLEENNKIKMELVFNGFFNLQIAWVKIKLYLEITLCF